MVFEAYRATGDRWAVRYRHPLSAYQAFAVAIAALHNPTSAMLDMLPPLDEVISPLYLPYISPISRLASAMLDMLPPLDEVRARARARARARVRFSDMLPPLD